MKHLPKIISGMVALMMLVAYTPDAFAAAITGLSDNMSRQKVSETSEHIVTFTLPTALAAAGTIDVTFPVGFTGTAATVTTDWAAAGNVLTYTDSGAGQAAGTTYSVTVTGLINPVGAGNQLITISSSNSDTGEITVPIITDDQIVITAKVDQTLFFDVIDQGDTDNAVGFGSLTSGAIRYANTAGTGGATEEANGASQFIAGTNATGGYTINVEGDTLTSGADTITAIAGVAPTAGQEEFGLTVDAVGGATGTITASYTGANYDLPAAATAETIVTQAGPVANETYGVNYVANIDSSTEAGNYSTSMTFTMTANF